MNVGSQNVNRLIPPGNFLVDPEWSGSCTLSPQKKDVKKIREIACGFSFFFQFLFPILPSLVSHS